jgi:hypothetical protein
MKRFGLGLVMWALLLLLLPFSVGGCNISCSCASTPDPNWTPAPIGTGEAAMSGAKFAGVPSMTAERIVGPESRTFYRATAPNTIALVDGDSGIVVEVVLEDQMPNDGDASATEDSVRAAAQAFMTRIGMTTEGFSESVQLIGRAGVAAYDIKWTQLGTVEVPKFEVLVNASTGAAFAYVDLRMMWSLTAPVIGRQKASELALAALGQPDAQVDSADFTIDFSAGTQSSTWTVGFGAAGATASDGARGSTLVRVNAVTGAATVEKS